jgi:hypothetical protein
MPSPDSTQQVPPSSLSKRLEEYADDAEDWRNNVIPPQLGPLLREAANALQDLGGEEASIRKLLHDFEHVEGEPLIDMVTVLLDAYGHSQAALNGYRTAQDLGGGLGEEDRVEAVARRMQFLYETAGEEPERAWADLSESVQAEWRGDARSVLQVALSQSEDGSKGRVVVELSVDEAVSLREELEFAEPLKGAVAKSGLSKFKTALKRSGHE